MKFALAVLGTILIGLTVASAQQDIVEQRHKLMESNGRDLGKVLGAMAKGEKPYDQAAVDTALAELERSAAKLPSLFPESTKGLPPHHKYSASPKIWEDRSDFDAHIKSYSEAVAEAKSKVKDLSTLKAAVPAIGKQCSGCHKKFRVKNG